MSLTCHSPSFSLQPGLNDCYFIFLAEIRLTNWNMCCRIATNPQNCFLVSLRLPSFFFLGGNDSLFTLFSVLRSYLFCFEFEHTADALDDEFPLESKTMFCLHLRDNFYVLYFFFIFCPSLMWPVDSERSPSSGEKNKCKDSISSENFFWRGAKFVNGVYWHGVWQWSETLQQCFLRVYHEDVARKLRASV